MLLTRKYSPPDIEGCRFGGNGVGLHTYASANNIDVIDSIFEGNTGVGYYVSGGAQINIEVSKDPHHACCRIQAAGDCARHS